MSEDCQKCGTAMYDLDEERLCPGCSNHETENETMTTNKTIDILPREQGALLVLIETFRHALHYGMQPTFSVGDLEFFIAEFCKLRALLDAPAPRAEFKKIEMAHVMSALGDVLGGPVITSNQCHDLALALNDRLLSPLQLLAMPAEYLAAAQPQGEPVVLLELVENKIYGGMHIARWENHGGLKEGFHKLYAQQPAQVALVMPKRLPDTRGLMAVYCEGWNACLDEVARLNK